MSDFYFWAIISQIWWAAYAITKKHSKGTLMAGWFSFIMATLYALKSL